MGLTKEEKQWVRKVQSLLNKTPSRFGFYTVGDPRLGIFDTENEHLFDQEKDLVHELDKYDAYLVDLEFPVNVQGVCG